jgi:DNA-binding LytR/AlgR family response regulator
MKMFSVLKFQFLSQAIAKQIDVDLMNPAVGGFSIDQVLLDTIVISSQFLQIFLKIKLMELAGLSVAQSIQKIYSPQKYPKILVCTGPGSF